MAHELTPILETAVTLADSDSGLKNEKLRQHTEAIIKLMNATKRNLFEIAARLLVIRDEKLYVEDGYESVQAYATEFFNYKPNMTYKLLVAAEKFIEKKADNTRFISILAHEDTDYTISQLIELNSLNAETAIQLDVDGVIEPNMTTKQIREAVKSYKQGVSDADGGSSDEGESDGTGEGECEGKNGGISDKDEKAITGALKALKKLSNTSVLTVVQLEQVDALMNVLENVKMEAVTHSIASSEGGEGS